MKTIQRKFRTVAILACLSRAYLEILVQTEVVATLAGVFRTSFLCSVHDTCFLVIGDALLKEVCLSCEGDVLHD